MLDVIAKLYKGRASRLLILRVGPTMDMDWRKVTKPLNRFFPLFTPPAATHFILMGRHHTEWTLLLLN